MVCRRGPRQGTGASDACDSLKTERQLRTGRGRVHRAAGRAGRGPGSAVWANPRTAPAHSRSGRGLLSSWLLVPGQLLGGQCPACGPAGRRPGVALGSAAGAGPGVQVWFVLLLPACPQACPVGSAPTALTRCPSEGGQKWVRLAAVRPGDRWWVEVAVPSDTPTWRPVREAVAGTAGGPTHGDARGRAVWWAVRKNGVARFTEESPLRMRRGGREDWLAGVAEHGAHRAPHHLPAACVPPAATLPHPQRPGGRGRGPRGGLRVRGE